MSQQPNLPFTPEELSILLEVAHFLLKECQDDVDLYCALAEHLDLDDDTLSAVQEKLNSYLD